MLVLSIWPANSPTPDVRALKNVFDAIGHHSASWDLLVSVSSSRSTRIPRVSIVRLLAPLLN